MSGFSEPLANHGAWEYDLDTGAIAWSDGVYRIHGVTPGEFVPTRAIVRDLIHPEDLEEYRLSVNDAVRRGAPFTVQHRIIRPPDGAVRTVIVRGAHMPDPAGGPGRLVGTTQDVTGRPSHEERLWHLANHDSLTGLFNRRRFLEELMREVAVARRAGTVGAVLMLDLDRFKEVNDSLGHMVGDGVIVEVAEALRSRLRVTDTLARLGGDEFAVVLPNCTTEQAREVAGALAGAVWSGAVVTIGGRERPTGVSIGIAPFGDRPAETADALLIEADLAMYRAKSRAGLMGATEIYDDEMRAELEARIRTEGELRGAIDDNQLRVVYQPIVSLDDGAPVGCEALVRWVHPVRGTIAPSEFIPVAEEYGLIGAIGEFVLADACRRATAWRREGRNVYVSVNVSPLQLVREDIVAVVSEALELADLPAPLLCLEMTETALLDDTRQMLPSLRRLKQLGVRLAIDDFGGGSSSFALLRMLPLDQIKVDRTFIEGLPARSEDRAIVAAVLSLAFEGRAAGLLDFTAELVGVPAGVTWFALRVEAFRGGRGDRFIPGTPGWIMALPTLAGIYVTAMVAAAIGIGNAQPQEIAVVAANLMLVVLYSAIGYYLIRTQLANRRSLGGWSLSGLALSIVFPTCAAMHAIYAFYMLTGQYQFDIHGTVIDWIAVPAAIYFLWVVHALYRGTYHDWNGAPGTVERAMGGERVPTPEPSRA